jgi:hypothetical protein
MQLYQQLPNVVVEWLTFRRRIQEVPGSKFDWRPAMLIEVSRGFRQSLQMNAGIAHRN